MLQVDVTSLLRLLGVGTATYAILLLVLRVTGKRTLSKMNAFDFIVTVAMGSLFASTIASSSVTPVNGVAAMTLLIMLQFVVTWLSVRVPFVARAVKASPRLLFYRGEFQRGAMRRERVTKGEVLSAIRAQGIARIEDVEAVVMETAGELTVLRHSSGGLPDALAQVKGSPVEEKS